MITQLAQGRCASSTSSNTAERLIASQKRAKEAVQRARVEHACNLACAGKAIWVHERLGTPRFQNGGGSGS